MFPEHTYFHVDPLFILSQRRVPVSVLAVGYLAQPTHVFELDDEEEEEHYAENNQPQRQQLF